ncbi:bifunctional glutamate/proline--tRNA ligase [Copidosoma floridanum]|uniref:bifunctional glutamate/proline--tRNA ligase n=1 Tax=Copidosoma floridanum TaxID=29053 RepID=UPI0006C94141|nr:bifunctional glutamate/proline--tRNA ligase [Copidosoma floridanum]XP_014217473.1 bifunctional glutamate/proline--tRNA ligase [Copidosoma floridanum]XP_014217474.1 bifunctional glutamate/proline--tRNA ligase [Copidosoma floridanum]
MMQLKLVINAANPPIETLATVELVKSKLNSEFQIVWSNDFGKNPAKLQLFGSNGKLLGDTGISVARYLSRARNDDLYGSSDAFVRSEVDHWLTFSGNRLKSKNEATDVFIYLNLVLSTRTWLVAKHLTIADICLFSELMSEANNIDSHKERYPNLYRWYKQVQALPEVETALEIASKNGSKEAKGSAVSHSKTVAAQKTAQKKEQAKFVDLPGAQKGKVVVRFPPEASGYLHIGHAKAALLNQYYADHFEGKLIMRFDDTNPAKENVEFEKAILEDLKMLQIKPDRFTHTSDYFDLMLDYCEKLIRNGKAFVDDTPAERMKEQRDQNLPSVNRDNTIEANLELWREMIKGSTRGQKCCVRAKINYQSSNGCLRDPTIYRCKPESHPKTGTKYKVYPTYDFACPIVDAIEGVTHTLRTTEYHDRDEQFYWFVDALGLHRPYIYEYSRLNMTNTVLSKRKLTWFVAEGLVDGWDDPRFPTVRGILRRGMTVEGLKQFIIAQGSSRSVVFMEWDKIWSFNKKVIDPVAVRYTALTVGDTVPVHVKGAVEGFLTVPNHPKDPSIGTKQVRVSPNILIEEEDAQALKQGQNATFINWGNLMIENIEKNANGKIIKVDASLNLDNKDFKNTLKLTWIAADKSETSKSAIPCYAVYFDHIITKPVLAKDDDFKDFVAKDTRREIEMFGETELQRVKHGEIIQLQRKGFFRCDLPYAEATAHSSREQPLILFHIPDGHSTIALPGAADKSTVSKVTKTDASAIELNEKIIAQGNKIRDLKSAKADKAIISADVEKLLNLKANYKSITGQDWKPSNDPPAVKTTSAHHKNEDEVDKLSKAITAQGNIVRKLKLDKVDKAEIDAAVKILVDLKAKWKSLTDQEWKPDCKSPALAPKKVSNEKAPEANSVISKNKKMVDDSNAISLSQEIKKQNDVIVNLKYSKPDAVTVTKQVAILMNLKNDYKKLTGKDWVPLDVSGNKKESSGDNSNLEQHISDQGCMVRELKAKKAEKSVIDREIEILKALKLKYKETFGKDYVPVGGGGQASREIKAKSQKLSQVAKPSLGNGAKKHENHKEDESSSKTGTRLGLEAKKSENLSDWYSQVITKGEMIEYYDVSGCYILRPWSFTIWDSIKDFFDREIKKLGVQNCYFPIFVSKAALEKEKTHIADFAPEVAWVTKSGESDLAEHIAIRPTSETVMYPAYAKWLKSYRDLPLKLNQWNNVVRWEFKHPQPFLRTREFLWQEGHSAFVTKAEADEEVLQILDLYTQIYEDFLAVPVVKGRKTEKEKFAGGDYTLTVEAYISASGRAIQGATSHHLGQNFSKMFDIQIEGAHEGGDKTFVYQNSWGITTRTIGVMIMVHGDDKGLVIPPRVASIQAIIVPCGITASTSQEQKDTLMSECNHLEKELIKRGELRIKGDYRDNYSPGWKFNHWELKGVPVRIELGPKDLEKSQVTFVRRDTLERTVASRAEAYSFLVKLLNQIQASLLEKARNQLMQHIKQTHSWNEFCKYLDEKNLILAPFCERIECEDKIKADSVRDDGGDEPGAPSMGAKSLCIPTNQPDGSIEEIKKLDCIHHSCQAKPKSYTLFGRSY